MEEGLILGGKYKLIKKIQSGGQATIYLALIENNELSFKKEVAIKFFESSVESNSNILSEIKILTELNHPNIAKIYDVGIHDKTPYIVLEYIDGLNLKELREKLVSKNIPFQIGDVLFILESVLSAIIFAHNFKKMEVLHRDISPSNIVISKDGFVKLIDFGISSFPAEKLAGRPTYLPKDFLEGKISYSKSVDYYSLAVVVYEILTETKVREEKDIDISLVSEKMIRKILKKLLECDAEAEEILKDIQRQRINYESNISSLVRKALDDLFIADRTIEDIETRTYKKKKRNSKPLIFSGAGLLVIIAGLLYLFNNPLRSNAEFIVEDVATRAKKQIAPPRIEMWSNVSNLEQISNYACKSYCYNNLAVLSSYHKDFYEKAKNDPQFKPHIRSTFKDHIHFFKQVYPALAIHFDHYNHLCSSSIHACSVAKSLFVHIGANAPLSISETELEQNLMRIFDGSDKKISRVLEGINEGDISAPKLYKYKFVEKIKGNDYNFILFDGDLNQQICRDIGDEAYLKRTVYKPEEAKQFNVLVFNNVINIKVQKDEKDLPFFWIGLVDESDRSIGICHYQRSEGKITILQSWQMGI